MRTSRPVALHVIFVLMPVLAVQVGWPSNAHAANPLFAAKSTGSQVVPATPSTGTTDVRVTLFGPSLVFLSGSFTGLSMACTAAHVHLGAPGANGPIVQPLACTAAANGTLHGSFAPATGDIDNIRNGLWYVDVHSVAFPSGEIRGQVAPLAAHIANLTGEQVVPTPTGIASTGFAEVTLNNAGTHLQLTVGYQDLAGGTTGIDLHGEAMPGVNAPLIATMVESHAATSANFVGISVPVTPMQVTQFKTGRMYVSVRSAAFPGGAIRGQLKPPDKPFDFDGDGRAEVAVFRLFTGFWYTVNPGTGAVRWEDWGTPGDLPNPGDYDGDGKSDLVIWRNGVFWIHLSATGGWRVLQWGANLNIDTPLATGDFDGDGRTDPAVYRKGVFGDDPSRYYIFQSVNDTPRIVLWGVGDDIDISADYDGDLKRDPAIYRTSNSTYYILGSTAGLMTRVWGLWAFDFLAPGDYDGDGLIDAAVYRYQGVNTGTWYVLKSSTLTLDTIKFGATGDYPAPADYDGDGKTDKAVVRPSGGAWIWYILRSSTGTMEVRQFGITSDVAMPRRMVR